MGGLSPLCMAGRLGRARAAGRFARLAGSSPVIAPRLLLLVAVLALGALLAAMVSPRLVLAGEAADKVTVTVLAIQASPNKGPIDPQLKDIAGKLKGVVAFESLKLLSRRKQEGAYGQELTFSLPEKMELVVTPLEERDGTIKMRCDLLRPDPEKPGGKKKLLPTLTVTAPKGEGYTIVGPALAEGRLVLVVSAE